MKAILFSVVALFLALGTVGCAAGSPSDTAASDYRLLDPAAHSDACPACQTKWARAGQNDKGHPNWKRVHVCPECKMEVVTVMKNGKWCHECINGPTNMNCKTCNPK